MYIEKDLVKWFQQTVTDKVIELDIHEVEFIEQLNELLRKGKFISQAMHDTFFALIEEKYNQY